MKTTTNKFKLLIEQVIILIFIDGNILYSEGFIYQEKWLSSLVFALMFFHVGLFTSIYFILKSTSISKEVNNLLTTFSFFILFSFLSLLCFHNCQVKTNQLAINFLVALAFLFISVIYFFNVINDYRTFKKQLALNQITVK